MSISKKQKIFLWIISPILLLLSFFSMASNAEGYAAFWFLIFIITIFVALSASSASKNAVKNDDVAKPNILIILPMYFLMRGEEPFSEMTKDYKDAKINAASVYITLFKLFIYNRLLSLKFGKEIYLSTILDKQREMLAKADLPLSETVASMMKMFQELEEVHIKDRENTDFESLIAYALIQKGEEFLDVKNDDDKGPEWMMKIANMLKTEREAIEKYFENCWQNSGFNKNELEDWLANT